MPAMNFEESMDRLEEIVKKLENTDVPLDDAIKLYEEGQELLTNLRQKLNKAETKIKKLTKTEQGFQLKELEDMEEK
ncbi:exodeoxyribonuclease VII small subunit [candidate division WOR-3 bacterium]|nr:exodeoxyribonuclease VII small subunit [candidate division WOR-3 bacterium]MCK4595980.1 exodeoxyribonuclease VII small subunit [candidate division WOR-3 bacterium]